MSNRIRIVTGLRFIEKAIPGPEPLKKRILQQRIAELGLNPQGVWCATEGEWHDTPLEAEAKDCP